MLTRAWHWVALAVAGVVLFVAAVLTLAGVLIYPNLPDLDVLTDYRPKVPLRVVTEDGALIGEFGEERRALVALEKVPLHLKRAILAAEDERFYHHGGVDTVGVLRAALSNVISGEAREGASTITMQVARNFFLSSEKSFRRKISEALLAIKIEHALSKDRIFELYINQIYLGQRAYGFAAAARVYFGKPLEDLTVAEAAMLAGLPKAPSRYNPVVNPRRAKGRQLYVLRRMRDLNFITEAERDAAAKLRLDVRQEVQAYDVRADHIAEMVRQDLYAKYGDAIYSSGMRVRTTLRRDAQEAANRALWLGVMEFDQRHGYRGPEGKVEIVADDTDSLRDLLTDVPEVNGLVPAVVLNADGKLLRAVSRHGDRVEIRGAGLAPAKRFLAGTGKNRIERGAIIRVVPGGKPGEWTLAQIPQVEAGFVAMDPATGAIRALVGGFDFSRNKFNHITQAYRQPGSSFKPFIYSAALEKGVTPATLIEDAPIVLDPFETGGVLWEPKNFDGEMAGPVTMRTGLAKSKNLVSIRILKTIGVDFARDHVTHFGFDVSRQPPYLTMALGAGSVTMMEMVRAYAVFANGGYLVQPFYIRRIEDAQGKLLFEAKVRSAGADAPVAIDARNAFIMTTLMQDVVRRGTAARAMSLGRADLAG